MKPAIFNTDMVRAILDGRKTNTRRPFSKYIKKIIVDAWVKGKISTTGKDKDFSDDDIKYLLDFAPYQKGDIIYVRETFSEWPCIDYESIGHVTYKADNEPCYKKWQPSIHMPKEYARLFLRVKDVRIERLNEISEEDAEREGIKYIGGGRIADTEDYFDVQFYYGDLIETEYGYENEFFEYADDAFQSLWESIYGKGSFNDDYVWVTEFEKITKKEAISETAT